ncbi:MAG: DUF2892 domain-containing protein [Bacillota bacterium]|nr:DUF2892 domain-containing protein [Bacillota bacterium]
MRRNLSDSERWVRGIAGAIAVFLGIIALAAAPWSTLAWFAGGALVLTGVAGYCPIYDVLNYSSVEVRPPDDTTRW